MREFRPMSGHFGPSRPQSHWPFGRLSRRRRSVDPGESTVPYFVNALYYPNWRIYRQQPPSSLRLGYVSHVFYAFAWCATFSLPPFLSVRLPSFGDTLTV